MCAAAFIYTASPKKGSRPLQLQDISTKIRYTVSHPPFHSQSEAESMDPKEISELHYRWRPEKSTVRRIY